MNQSSQMRIFLITCTVLFVAWAMLNTLFWPVEDYANTALAYAESTNQIARGMSIGIAAYLSAIAITIGWYLTRSDARRLAPMDVRS